ncbi:DNA-binding response regulator [Actinomyces sp. Z5]|uniref:LuxR C-terminal-related transcriptional regulator n=1 Tax=Actinomyces sp. Z5 TaxID=2250216 RepID=UPI000DCC8206|nr:response regulator transcription factor [Actinomyces sp. Z5]RAX24107.1 DNA-binding response regulator [Actinomyces sp. Z5]
MRIVLADDAALLREGLAGLLTAAGHEVVAQVADADALRTEVEQMATAGALPDVVVTDVRMPPTGTDDGLRAAIALRAAYPGLPVVVLSAYVAGPYLRELLDGPDAGAGGVGYLLKERVGRVSDFMRSLDVVAAGGVVVDPEVLSRLMRAGSSLELTRRYGLEAAQGDAHAADGRRAEAAYGRGRAAEGTALTRLTPREQEVLALMAEGLSNSQVAERLVVSDGAVAKHVANIFAKLDLPPEEGNRRVRAVLTWLRAHA